MLNNAHKIYKHRIRWLENFVAWVFPWENECNLRNLIFPLSQSASKRPVMILIAFCISKSTIHSGFSLQGCGQQTDTSKENGDKWPHYNDSHELFLLNVNLLSLAKRSSKNCLHGIQAWWLGLLEFVTNSGYLVNSRPVWIMWFCLKRNYKENIYL